MTLIELRDVTKSYKRDAIEIRQSGCIGPDRGDVLACGLVVQGAWRGEFERHAIVGFDASRAAEPWQWRR